MKDRIRWATTLGLRSTTRVMLCYLIVAQGRGKHVIMTAADIAHEIHCKTRLVRLMVRELEEAGAISRCVAYDESGRSPIGIQITVTPPREISAL